jgi:hypothetical protein
MKFGITSKAERPRTWIWTIIAYAKRLYGEGGHLARRFQRLAGNKRVSPVRARFLCALRTPRGETPRVAGKLPTLPGISFTPIHVCLPLPITASQVRSADRVLYLGSVAAISFDPCHLSDNFS